MTDGTNPLMIILEQVRQPYLGNETFAYVPEFNARTSIKRVSVGVRASVQTGMAIVVDQRRRMDYK